MVIIIAIFAGIALGFVGGTDLILIPWAITSLLVGYLSSTKKRAVFKGFLFGFFLIFFFMVGGYRGNVPLLFRVPPFFVLGLIGGICGLFGGLIGFFIKIFLKK